MLKEFKELIERYGSKELGMAELRAIEKSGLVSFDNQGISRTNRDCLLCVVTCDELAQFKKGLLSYRFPSYDAYERFVSASGFAWKKEHEEAYVTYRSEEGFFEFSCTLLPEGGVDVDSDDIILQESFNVYLRVQH